MSAASRERHLHKEQGGGEGSPRISSAIHDPDSRARKYVRSAEYHSVRSDEPRHAHEAAAGANLDPERGDDRRGGGGGGGGEDIQPAVVMCDKKVGLVVGGGVFGVILVVVLAMIVDSCHVIDEGTVGIYYVQGALGDEISHPGVHWSVPFVTTIEEVVIRPQTDTLRPISSVTKDGIENTFRDIQVLSDVRLEKLIPLVRKFGLEFRKALVFDRISEELRTFCAKHTIDEVYNTKFLEIVEEVRRRVQDQITRLGDGGIKILNLVIPKPEIPRDIASNYKAVKVQWTEQLVATQQQKTEKIKKETESIKAVLDAEREKKVLEIDIQKDIIKKEGDKNISSLENAIIREREQSLADVANYMKKKEAEANDVLYSDAYVKLEMARSLSNNTKFFFSGEQSVLGGLLNNIMNG